MKLPGNIPEEHRLKRKMTARCTLKETGWSNAARGSLEKLIRQGAGKGLPAVFDFDNTIVAGDIGEAVLAILSRQKRITPKSICPTLCPSVRAGARRLRIAQCSDVMQYYEALLAPTIHGDADPTPLANGYVWATQALENLALHEITAASQTAFELGLRGEQIRAGTHVYPAPRFFEQVVELIARLLNFDYQVWVVSASNVWSVRWMVAQGLNPLLNKHGAHSGITPNHVIGVATLLSDRNGDLHKDSVLVRQNRAYAGLTGDWAGSLRITRHLQFPAPVYSGKVACILDAIGTKPYFCAGDSPSDHAMLRLSRHRLWFARPDKPKSQKATRDLIREFGDTGWILQDCFDTGGTNDFQQGSKHSRTLKTPKSPTSVTARPRPN